MPLKKFELATDLFVTVYKRRGSKSIRLSISQEGDVKVTMPYWLPYAAGTAFAESKRDWILSQRVIPTNIVEGQAIGKSHTLHFKVSVSATKPSSRLADGKIIITHPLKTPASDSSVQVIAEKAAIRTLRKEAATLLPPRLKQHAKQHGFEYSGVTIKQLKTRWGSCDQSKQIALNLYLMQLPWELIGYVLLHELVHTEHMNHGPNFWDRLEQVRPDAKDFRSRMRKHKPVVLR